MFVRVSPPSLMSQLMDGAQLSPVGLVKTCAKEALVKLVAAQLMVHQLSWATRAAGGNILLDYQLIIHQLVWVYVLHFVNLKEVLNDDSVIC